MIRKMVEKPDGWLCPTVLTFLRIVNLKGYVFFSSCVSIVQAIERKFQHEDKHKAPFSADPTSVGYHPSWVWRTETTVGDLAMSYLSHPLSSQFTAAEKSVESRHRSSLFWVDVEQGCRVLSVHQNWGDSMPSQDQHPVPDDSYHPKQVI